MQLTFKYLRDQKKKKKVMPGLFGRLEQGMRRMLWGEASLLPLVKKPTGRGGGAITYLRMLFKSLWGISADWSQLLNRVFMNARLFSLPQLQAHEREA